ncbi:hypothetical protein DL769_001552 [Monosporascus sp. CRB-8-3]|nr:hypothetical protein DL769_001552 [Monosporascus sp. CRB-8-3]
MEKFRSIADPEWPTERQLNMMLGGHGRTSFKEIWNMEKILGVLLSIWTETIQSQWLRWLDNANGPSGFQRWFSRQHGFGDEDVGSLFVVQGGFIGLQPRFGREIRQDNVVFLVPGTRYALVLRRSAHQGRYNFVCLAMILGTLNGELDEIMVASQTAEVCIE